MARPLLKSTRRQMAHFGPGARTAQQGAREKEGGEGVSGVPDARGGGVCVETRRSSADVVGSGGQGSFTAARRLRLD